jgi:hypothetical protein
MCRRPLLLLLLLTLGGCPATQSGSTRDDDEGGDKGSAGSEGGAAGDDDDDGTKVRIPYRKVPDAIVENSNGTRPRRDVARTRELLCEGRDTEDKIFYQLVISKHWYYYWLCSEPKARRVSTKVGSKRLNKWINDFKTQAGMMSRDCEPGSANKCITGTHESGIQASAYCDGRIVLNFPDGEKKTLSFKTQASGGSEGKIEGGDEGDRSTATCPPCPTCPTVRGRCPDCPAPTPCPPPRTCPVCPACDCRTKEVDAGKKGFAQGVKKACARICNLMYNKCRSINPGTAMCHMLAEYCSTDCSK